MSGGLVPDNSPRTVEYQIYYNRVWRREERDTADTESRRRDNCDSERLWRVQTTTPAYDRIHTHLKHTKHSQSTIQNTTKRDTENHH